VRDAIFGACKHGNNMVSCGLCEIERLPKVHTPPSCAVCPTCGRTNAEQLSLQQRHGAACYDRFHATPPQATQVWCDACKRTHAEPWCTPPPTEGRVVVCEGEYVNGRVYPDDASEYVSFPHRIKEIEDGHRVRVVVERVKP